MIKTFRGEETRRLFQREPVGRFQAVERAARRKLEMIDAASALRDLAVIPGNRLEKLKGNREGHYSMRINDQWRVCFTWRGDDAYEVEITDYH